jgi:Mg-chelatase subunit ChlD
LLVATDGRDPRLASAIEAASAAGVEVSILPMGESPTVDAFAISSVDAPRLLRAEETSDVAVSLYASRDADVRLEAFFDGRSVLTETHHASRGTSSARLSLRFPEDPGVHELEIAVRGEGGLGLGQRSLAHARRGAPPSRACASTTRATALRSSRRCCATRAWTWRWPRRSRPSRASISTSRTCSSSPTRSSSAICPTINSARSARGSRTRGGGLITASFNHPIRRTPRTLREIEPIEPPPAQPEPRPLELVIVIDRSSSMSGAPMEQARSSAIAAVRALRRDALVGSVAFSGGADRVIAPVPMDQSEQVVQFISGIHAEGGTNIAAAITAANHIMSNDPRYIHHVILISDGESEPQSAIAAAMALAGRGVSITTITIGSYSQLLAEIARIGRGRYHVTNAGGLRSLVVSEAMMRQPPAHRQTPFAMREATHLSMFDGMSFEGAPAITGHALAGLRPGATQVLTATEGMPLLAHWHRGLGQVASWTSATSGSWTDGLRTSPMFRQLFTRLARGMLRTRTVEPPRIVIERDPALGAAAPRDDRVAVRRRGERARGAPLPRRECPQRRDEQRAAVRRGAADGDRRAGRVAGLDPHGLHVPRRCAHARGHRAHRGGGRRAPLRRRARGLRPRHREPRAPRRDRRRRAPRGAPGDHRGGEPGARDALAAHPPLLLLALFFYLFSLLVLRLPDRALATGFEVERPSRIPQPSRRSVPPAETKEAA